MQSSTYTKTMISKELSMKLFTQKLLVLAMLDIFAVSYWLLKVEFAKDLVSVANFIVGLVALLLKLVTYWDFPLNWLTRPILFLLAD